MDINNLYDVLDILCAYLLVNFEVLDDDEKTRMQTAILTFAKQCFDDPDAALKSCPNYASYLFE